MSIVTLADGAFEATVDFGTSNPRQFRYATRAEAQPLIDAEEVYNLLGSKATRDRCSDAQIVAASDAVSAIPCGDNTDCRNWKQMISHQIRGRVNAVPNRQ